MLIKIVFKTPGKIAKGMSPRYGKKLKFDSNFIKKVGSDKEGRFIIGHEKPK